MESQETVRIIICGLDENILQNIKFRLKELLSKLPVDIQILETGKKVIQDVRDNQTQIIILEEEVPGYELLPLVQELDRISGECYLFVLYKSVAPAIDGITPIQIPIISWNNFADQIVEIIPTEIRSRHGLQRRNSLLIQNLEKYAIKYEVSNPIEGNSQTPVLVPISFNFWHEQNQQANQTSQKTSHSYSIVPQGKWTYISEVAILLSLSFFTIWIWRNYPDDNIISIPVAATFITAFAYMGFFLSLTLKKLIINEK